MDTSSSSPPKANPTHRLRRVHILGHPVPLPRLPPNVLLGLAALAAVATSWLLFSTLAFDIARARTPCEPEAAGNTGLHHGRRLSEVVWNPLAHLWRSRPEVSFQNSKAKDRSIGIRVSPGADQAVQRSGSRKTSGNGDPATRETKFSNSPGEPDSSLGAAVLYQAGGRARGRLLRDGKFGKSGSRTVLNSGDEAKGGGEEEEDFIVNLEEDEEALAKLLQKQKQKEKQQQKQEEVEVSKVKLPETGEEGEGRRSSVQRDFIKASASTRLDAAQKGVGATKWQSGKGSSAVNKEERPQFQKSQSKTSPARGFSANSEQTLDDDTSALLHMNTLHHHRTPNRWDPLAVLTRSNTYPTSMWRNSSLVSNFPWKLTDALLEENEVIFQENLAKRAAHLADATVSNRILDPLYPCPLEERFGAWGEGGKWICLLPYLTNGKKQPVVYSIGCAGDTGFEYDVFAVLGSKPHTYDHTVKGAMQDAMKAIDFMTFHPIGLGGRNATNLKQIMPKWEDGRIVAKEVTWDGYNLKPLKALMAANGHKFIDIFKIDCEGCEIGFAEYLAQETTRQRPLLGQILVEIHSLETRPELDRGVVQTLEHLGYRNFHSEQNFYCGTCYEVAFVHESLVKPRK